MFQHVKVVVKVLLTISLIKFLVFLKKCFFSKRNIFFQNGFFIISYYSYELGIYT